VVVLEVVLAVLVVVMTREEELVVLAELRSTAVLPASISAAGAAANPVALAATADVVVVDDVVVTELDAVVVTRVAMLLVLSDAADRTPAAARGIAVHRRPSMVVTKAPEGRPLDAMFRSSRLSSSSSSPFRSRSLSPFLINPKSAWPAARRNEEKRGNGTKPKNTMTHKNGGC